MSKTVSFEAFLEGWEEKQGKLLEELSEARAKDGRVEEEEMKELIARALSLFEEYYEEKSRAAHCDAFRLFSPKRCSPLECAFYWICGFPPTAMLRLVSATVDDLSAEQLLRLDKLKSETKQEQKALSDEQARIQETIAAPPVAGVFQGVGWHPQGIKEGDLQADLAMKTIADEMEMLVGLADNLRGRTATGIVVILTMKQSIRVLEATIRLQRNIKQELTLFDEDVLLKI